MVMHTPSSHNPIPTSTPHNGSNSYVTPPSHAHSQPSSFTCDQHPASASYESSMNGGPSLFGVLQTLQTSIDRQLSKVNDSVNGIYVRLEKIEEKQSHFENDLKSISTTTTPSTGSCSETGGTKRKRLTPTALQVFFIAPLNSKILMFHGCLEQDSHGSQCI